MHPLREALVGSVRQSMFVLLGAVGLVLLIVCVNVASLVLIRAVGRGRELAVRVAVGAGRFSLIRGLLVESLMLGVAGGAVGPAAGVLGDHRDCRRSIRRSACRCSTRRASTPRSSAFTLGVSVLAAVLFGTMPAWQATSITDVVTRIREEGGSTTSDPKRQRMRSLLIVAETTLAVVLLVGAGLLARSFARLLAVDLGFDVRRGADVCDWRCRTRATRSRCSVRSSSRRCSRAVATHPECRIGRRHLRAAADRVPLTGSRRRLVDGVTLSDDEQDRLTLQIRVVTPDYFKTMGIPITRGRGFTAGRPHGIAAGR